jgi:hypothetical protein
MSQRHSAKWTNWRRAKKTQPQAFSPAAAPLPPANTIGGEGLFPEKNSNHPFLSPFIRRDGSANVIRSFDSGTEPVPFTEQAWTVDDPVSVAGACRH